MNTDLSKLESLLDEGKYDEARTVITETVNAAMTPAEKGESMASLAEIYLEITNNVNARYKAALETAIAGMEQINRAEAKTGDAVRLAEARKGLRS